MRSSRTNARLRLSFVVTKGSGIGPVSGLTARVSVLNPNVENSWLDWNDATFKTTGWTSRYSTISPEDTNEPGMYGRNVELGTDLVIPAGCDSVIPFFEVTAPDESVGKIQGEEIWFDTPVEDLNDPDAATVAAAVWDEILTGATHNITNSAGKRLRQQAEAVVAAEGVVADVSASTTSFDTNLTQVDGFWNDTILVFIDGALTGQARTVASYTNASGTITFDEPLTSAPVDTSAFLLLATHVHPLGQIADAIWNEARAGHATVGTFGEHTGAEVMRGTDSANTVVPLDAAADTAAHAQTQTDIAAVVVDIGNLNDLDGVAVQAALTAQGYTTIRATKLDNLDNLDATVSSVNDAVAALNDLDGAGVQAAMTTQGYTTARAALLDNLDAAITSLKTENLQTQLYFANLAIDGSRKVPAGAVSHAAITIRPDGGAFGAVSWYVWFNYGSTQVTAAGSGSSKPFAVAPTDDGGAGFSTVVIPS